MSEMEASINLIDSLWDHPDKANESLRADYKKYSDLIPLAIEVNAESYDTISLFQELLLNIEQNMNVSYEADKWTGEPKKDKLRNNFIAANLN
ncbi:hypothetical protein [Terribacillus halophilus]|nr:hypothetical protein [Terribacillus halophilus]